MANIEFDGYICNDGHYIRFNNEILIDEQFDNEMVQKQLDVYAKYNGRSMFNGRGGAWCSFLDDELVIKHRAMFQGTTERPTDVNEVFIVEEAVEGFEVGCAIIGNDELTVGEVDEIELSGGFFDYRI